MYRIVICIDVDASSSEEAYQKIHEHLNYPNISWESTDEWYDSDGMLLDEEEISKARMKFFDKNSDQE